MTGAIVRRTEQDLAAWTCTEWGFVSGFMHWDGEPVRLERYQLQFLQDRSRFRWITKGRQTGFSFAFALEALARCHLRDGNTTLFVSYNQSDATEKIMVARQLYDELPTALQKRLVTDTRTELAFESNARGKRVSRFCTIANHVYFPDQIRYFIEQLIFSRCTNCLHDSINFKEQKITVVDYICSVICNL